MIAPQGGSLEAMRNKEIRAAKTARFGLNSRCSKSLNYQILSDSFAEGGERR